VSSRPDVGRYNSEVIHDVIELVCRTLVSTEDMYNPSFSPSPADTGTENFLVSSVRIKPTTGTSAPRHESHREDLLWKP